MRTLFIGFFFISTVLSQVALAQRDDVGSGGALYFDGVDDFIDFGDVYPDLELPFTISAWVYVDPTSNHFGPIFTNRNCDPVYTGFRLIVSSTVISLDYGDGIGGNNPAFRRGRNATVPSVAGHWNHVTAVVVGTNDIRLYLNGVNVDGVYQGDTSLPMDSSKPGFGSTAYFISNGREYRFKGMIDDIRLWDKALSETAIRQTMCTKLNGNEEGLIGYWDFNETSGTQVEDRSPTGADGVFRGAPVRVRSGAAIGDVSTFVYLPSWNGGAVTLENGGQTIEVSDVSPGSKGVQIYSVHGSPSSTTGISFSPVSGPYFGVFLAVQNPSNTFQASFPAASELICSNFFRKDNSTPTWSKSPAFQARSEIIMGAVEDRYIPHLGEDITSCFAEDVVLTIDVPDNNKQILWSTGATGPSIVVSTSGSYTVSVTGVCETTHDEINIQFLTPPASIDFPDDIVSCEVSPIELILPPCNGCEVEWQDGSSGSEYQISSHGEYWVVLKNLCGQSSDTFNVLPPTFEDELQNVVTANDDGDNDYFFVPEEVVGSSALFIYNRWGRQVWTSPKYSNNWNGQELDEGIYYFLLNTPCGSRRGWIHLIR